MRISALYLQQAFVSVAGNTEGKWILPIVLLALLIWCTGMIICLFRLLYRYRTATKELRSYQIYDTKQCQEVLKQVKAFAQKNSGRMLNVEIRSDSRVIVPMGFGIFKRTILLPDEAYSDTELYYILCHEYTHFQNHDIEAKFFVQMICCLFWWLPFIYPLKKDVMQALEIRCDLHVTNGMENEERAAYLTTIISVLKRSAAKSQNRKKCTGKKYTWKEHIRKKHVCKEYTQKVQTGINQTETEIVDEDAFFWNIQQEEELLERFRVVTGNHGFAEKNTTASGRFKLHNTHMLYTKIRFMQCKKRIIHMKNIVKTSLKTSVTLKALLRSPLKTALTFLLIAAASFALFSKATDYAVTAREVKTAESYYHGVASPAVSEMSMKVGEETIYTSEGAHSMGFYVQQKEEYPTEETLKAFSGLPGATLEDKRYMTAGYVDNYKRISTSDDVYSYYILEATYAGYEKSAVIADEDNPYIDIKLEDVKVLACDDDCEVESSIVLENTYVRESQFGWENPVSKDYFENIEVGSRCILVGLENIYQKGKIAFDNINTGSRYFRVIEDPTADYLETEEYADWKNMIDKINRNYYVYDIVYTADVRAIPCFNSRGFVISDGRSFTSGETDACVVNEKFLEKNGLSIGDTIHIKLEDKLYHNNNSARARVREEAGTVAGEAELTIVGAFRRQDKVGDDYFYTANTIFVPSALLPVKVPEDYEYLAGDYSIFAENAYDIERFRNAAQEAAESADLGLLFSDGGWTSVKEQFEMGSVTSILTTVIYAAGAIIAILLAVYLYIGRNKKSYAILRTLGMPGNMAGVSLALPFVVLAALAIPAGGLSGLYYAQATAKTTLRNLMEGSSTDFTPSFEMPFAVIVGCLLFELLFISGIVWLFLRKMQNTPPLELLQDNTIRTRAGKMCVTELVNNGANYGTVDFSKISYGSELPADRNYSAVRHVFAYVLRHMRRSIGKTAISLFLTVILTAGIGLLILTRITYAEAFDHLAVQGKAFDFSSDSVERLKKSDLIRDLYAYGDIYVCAKEAEEMLHLDVTTDPEAFLGTNNDITFDKAYDFSWFEMQGHFCLVGEGIAKKLGIVPGDDLYLMSSVLFEYFTKEANIDEESLTKQYEQYRVIGTVASKDLSVNNSIIMGMKNDAESLCGGSFLTQHCEFLLKDNTKAKELSELLENEKQVNLRYSKTAACYLDIESLRNIERICSLLETLFPIAVTATVLIGLFSSLLLILQSPLEAVLMRAMGVNKARVRCMILSEQIILCTSGILFVTMGLALSKPGLFKGASQTIICCFGLYFAGCICGAVTATIQVTKNRILELLQCE